MSYIVAILGSPWVTLVLGVAFILILCRREYVRYRLSRMSSRRRQWYRFEFSFLLPSALFLDIVGTVANVVCMVQVWIALN